MKFTARDHAYVYGVIAQEIMSRCEGAEAILEEAIKVYGLQRGSRMGQTCDLFGDERSMQTYMAYGEWAPAPGEMDIAIPEESPSAVWNVKKCPWSQEWTEKGMLEYENDSGEVRVYNSQGDHKPGETDGDNKKYTVVWKRDGTFSKQTQFEIAHFAECVRTGATPLTNGRDTLQGLRVIWKTYEAEKNNTIADLRGLGLSVK